MGNSTTTSWILEMVDEITKPIKNAIKSISKGTDAIDEMTDAVNFSEKETKEALSKSKKHFKDLQSQVANAKDEISDLRDEMKKAKGTAREADISQAYDDAVERLKRLQEALRGAREDVDDLTESVEEFNQESKKWGDIATGVNQATELMQKAVDGLDFTVDVNKLQTEVARMTDLTGKDLDNFVMKSRKIADVYDEDALEIARSANAMTKLIGGTYEENLALIDEGFKRGANTNGDFLDQLQEYPAFIKQLGLTQSQAIALMAKAGKGGLFSDKALDSLKEGTLSIKEMGKTQVQALAGINVDPEELVGKTPFEALQYLSSKMKGMTVQARQLILADIFKGAGEDAGIEFITALSDMDLDLTHLPAVEQAGADMKGFFSEIKTWAGQTFGDIGSYAQMIAPLIMTISGIIPIYQALSKVTWLQNLATSALNVTQGIMNALFIASPIGWIVLGIAALVAIVMLCWEKFEGFRRVIFQGWEALKLFGTVIKDFVIDRIKGILTGITGIGKALMHFFKGEWTEAWETGKQAASEIVGIDAGVKAAKNFKSGWSGAMADGLEAHNKNEAERNAKKSKEDTGIKVNELLQAPPDVLGPVKPDDKAKGKKEGDGLNVGSGSNGIKSIVMTLNVVNNFKPTAGTNVRQLAEQFTGDVNDLLRDSVINLGG